MKKLLSLMLVLLLASTVWAAPTIDQAPAGKIIQTKYLAVYEVVDFDSIQGSTLTDTTTAFPLNSFGFNQPFPDAVSFQFGVKSVEVTTNTKVDTFVVRLDGCVMQDSTDLAERSLAWHPIAFNDNSNGDTVATGDGDDLGNVTYWATGQLDLSAAELAAAAGCTYGRFVFTKTGDQTANDTVHVEVKMIQRYTGWISQ